MANFAFIDSQNVNLGIRAQGWKIDFARFRTYLKEKHAVEKAYLFLGYMHEHQRLYTMLQDAGFILVFKPTQMHRGGAIKGSCDAELVLQAMIEYDLYDQAVIVTGDGDFYCLARYLYSKGKLACVMVPNELQYSGLLKKAAKERLLSMNALHSKIGRNDERENSKRKGTA